MATIVKQKKRKRETNTYSKQEAQAYYNTPQWKKLRKAYLMEHPLCEMCLEKGIVKPTEEIHHIKPVLSGNSDLERKELAFDANNLMALCKDCHHKIHNLMK